MLAARGTAALWQRFDNRGPVEPRSREARKERNEISSRSLRLGGEVATAVALIGLLSLEYLAIPVPHAPIETGAGVPPVYRWLAEHEFEGGVFELPTARTHNITGDQLSIRRMARQQYFSTYHWRPIVIGYSGTNAPTFEDVIDYAPAAASPDGVEFLWQLGVRRLVVHRDQMTWDEWATFAEAASRRPGLEPIAEVGQSAVYAVTPAEGGPERRRRPVEARFDEGLVLAAVDAPAIGNVIAGEALVVTLEWNADPAQARDRAASLQVLDEAGGRVAQAEFFFPAGDEWPAGRDGALLQRAIVPLPRDLVPGRYSLNVVVYEQSDLALVGDPVELAALNVRQPPDLLIQRPLRATLGEAARLIGFDAEFTARRGEAFSLALYWRRLNAMPEDYTVFVHLRRPDGSVLAQQDNPPRLGSYPTSRWRAGETVIDRYSVSIPPDAAPGSYALMVGMYLPPGAVRLPAYDAQGNLLPGESIRLGLVEGIP
jgi:hypothetical protein